MISGAIEALYLFNSATNEPILDHVYRGRPPPSGAVLAPYLAQPTPRPSVLYLGHVNPPSTLFSLAHANVLLLSPASSDTEPLAVLEFLQRVADALEEFLGAPLLASKIDTQPDVAAQLLGEMCDGGAVCVTEPNALREAVSVPGWVDKLLGGVGLPASTPGGGGGGAGANPLRAHLALQPAGPAIPWRRANVKHTSNELYVDIVETLRVKLAPSGRPLAAAAHGSVLFTAKISGVPDLVLSLAVPGGRAAVARVLDLPTFHPCVRLGRWRDRPGELSFVPPDGRFVLAGYQVDLLPPDPAAGARALDLPAFVEVATSLGPAGNEFEVRLVLGSASAASAGSASLRASAASSLRQAAPSSSGRSTPTFFGLGGSGGGGGGPSLQDLEVAVPLPAAVRAVNDLRASRGEAVFSQLDREVSWRISAKEAAAGGSATLRCTVVGALGAGTADDAAEAGAAAAAAAFDAANGEYVAEEDYAYQAGPAGAAAGRGSGGGRKPERDDERDARRVALNRSLMPKSAAVSFGVKGWLPSGVRVESLTIDAQRSRGLGEGVKPVKGAKYLTVSRRGVETRC